MKNKTILALICLMLILLSACGSPTAGFAKSKNEAQNTVIIERGKTYAYDSFKFTLGGIRAASPAPKGSPKGKWIEVTLNLVGGSISDDAVNRFVEGENILLNGIAAKNHEVQMSFNAETMRINKQWITIYFDMPKDFDAGQAAVTCSTDVTS